MDWSDQAIVAELRALRDAVNKSSVRSGAEFGRRMNGILDDAARSAW